jgi:hypothetical protein
MGFLDFLGLKKPTPDAPSKNSQLVGKPGVPTAAIRRPSNPKMAALAPKAPAPASAAVAAPAPAAAPAPVEPVTTLLPSPAANSTAVEKAITEANAEKPTLLGGMSDFIGGSRRRKNLRKKYKMPGRRSTRKVSRKTARKGRKATRKNRRASRKNRK